MIGKRKSFDSYVRIRGELDTQRHAAVQLEEERARIQRILSEYTTDGWEAAQEIHREERIRIALKRFDVPAEQIGKHHVIEGQFKQATMLLERKHILMERIEDIDSKLQAAKKEIGRLEKQLSKQRR